MKAWTAAILIPAASAGGWDFTPLPVCTLSQSGPDAEMRITYDPARTQPYMIEVSTSSGWDDPQVFAIQFDGPLPLTISTNRHELSADTRTLIVRDNGFGNVLNGLEFNDIAIAMGETTIVPFSLVGATPKVHAFRACTEAPVA